jgi:hypothetical protein
MSHYDDIREQYKDTSLEDKIALVKRGKFQYLSEIIAHAEKLKAVRTLEVEGLPDDYIKWCDQIINSANNFQDEINQILGIVDDVNHQTRNPDSAEHSLEVFVLINYGKIRYLSTIEGLAEILKSLPSRGVEKLPTAYIERCDDIIASTTSFCDEIDGILDNETNNREIRRLKKEEHNQEFALMMWNSDQKKLLELNNYHSLQEAIFDRLDNFSVDQLSPFERTSRSHYLTSVEFGRPQERYIRIGIHYMPGYSIHLSQTIDKRNFTSRNLEGVTRSIDETCDILKEWMIQTASFESILREYPWLKEVPYP